jgi:hypothetical protein
METQKEEDQKDQAERDIFEKLKIRTMSGDLGKAESGKGTQAEEIESHKKITVLEELEEKKKQDAILQKRFEAEKEIQKEKEPEKKEQQEVEKILKEEEKITETKPETKIESPVKSTVKRITSPYEKSGRELSPQERLAYGINSNRPKTIGKPISKEKESDSKSSKRSSIFDFLSREQKHPNLAKASAFMKTKKFLALIIFIAVIGIGSFVYYNFYYNPDTPTPAPPVAQAPKTLVPMEKNIVISYSEGENVFSKTLTELQRMKDLPEAARLNIKNQKGDYLKIEDVPEKLKIKIPAELLKEIKNYNLFVFSLKGESLRLGLAFEMNNVQAAKNLAKNWESAMRVNLKTLFLNSYIGAQNTPNFQNNIYKGVSIYYLNFPNPSITMDYAFVGDKMIITTSKESMYKIIDALK